MALTTEETISAFHDYVNMSAEELQEWLDGPESTKAGTGVGLESGRRILEILRKNPQGEDDGYDQDDLAHMRKVDAYCKRHLAQEDHLKETKTPEELKHTKSTISLKNWGHDPLKELDEDQEQGDEDQGQREATNEIESIEPPQETGTSKRKRDASTDEGGDASGEDDKNDEVKTPVDTKADDSGVIVEHNGGEDGGAQGKVDEEELEIPAKKRTRATTGAAKGEKKTATRKNRKT